MLLPSIFGESLFDDMFDFDKEMNRMNRALYGKHGRNMMKTDVREINVQLDNGYLSISAAKGLDKDEEKKNSKYIRRERYAGAMSRTFYVGDNLTQQDIKAKFENGILKISVPKKDVQQVAQNNHIAIE